MAKPTTPAKKLKTYLSLFKNRAPFLITNYEDNKWLFSNILLTRALGYQSHPDDRIHEVLFTSDDIQFIYEHYPIFQTKNLYIDLSIYNKLFNKLKLDKTEGLYNGLDEFGAYVIIPESSISVVIPQGKGKVKGNSTDLAIASRCQSKFPDYKEEQWLKFVKAFSAKHLGAVDIHKDGIKVYYGKVLDEFSLDSYLSIAQQSVINKKDEISSPIDSKYIDSSNVYYIECTEAMLPTVDNATKKCVRIPLVEGHSNVNIFGYAKKQKIPFENHLVLWAEKYVVKTLVTFVNEHVDVRTLFPGSIWFPYKLNRGGINEPN